MKNAKLMYPNMPIFPEFFGIVKLQHMASSSSWVQHEASIYIEMTSYMYYYHDDEKSSYLYAGTAGPFALTHWGLETHMRQLTGTTLVQVMACRLFGAKQFSKPILVYSQSDIREDISVKSESKYSILSNRIWKYRLESDGYFFTFLIC